MFTSRSYAIHSRVKQNIARLQNYCHRKLTTRSAIQCGYHNLFSKAKTNILTTNQQQNLNKHLTTVKVYNLLQWFPVVVTHCSAKPPKAEHAESVKAEFHYISSDFLSTRV